jgi:hypothetical protein
MPQHPRVECVACYPHATVVDYLVTGTVRSRFVRRDSQQRKVAGAAAEIRDQQGLWALDLGP